MKENDDGDNGDAGGKFLLAFILFRSRVMKKKIKADKNGKKIQNKSKVCLC